jgi:hypothetical protein
MSSLLAILLTSKQPRHLNRQNHRQDCERDANTNNAAGRVIEGDDGDCDNDEYRTEYAEDAD